MALISQKEAARRFSKKWEGKGREKQDDSKFWLELIQDVFRVSDPFSLIEFQKPVKMDSSTRYIDAFIPETRVLIEQKGVDVDLSKKYLQSGGDMLTPYEQAHRYDQWLLPDEHPLWIVVCNFKSFEIHDMQHPFEAPEVVLLENLSEEYHRLSFITDANKMHIQREKKVSLDAGEIVGKIYDAILSQYLNPSDESTMHSLNVLCVRFVFCLYAEDSGIFGKDQFHNYLKGIPAEDMRDGVLRLFEVLDTPEDQRSPYLKESLKAFPYTNGGLFHDRTIEVPMFTDDIKDILIRQASSEFNWSVISPTIFGAVFESTLNPETRHDGGMHYTSIENIHKVIDPLFLDDIIAEFQKIKDDRPISGRKDKEQEWRRKMIDFQEKLASLTFLDPACGSGNFLTETYLSLRRIENSIIRELNDENMNIGFDDDIIKVKISQFYGIEINDFAADVARTALWISEAQMMDETRSIVQKDMNYLPLTSNTNIRTANALRIDWSNIIHADNLDYIMGNPPFQGARIMSAAQKDDLKVVFGTKWKNIGNMDYVSGWYWKSLEMMQKNNSIRVALVSTNSITQGEQVPLLWKPLKLAGIHIDYAWRSFIWNSEAIQKAHVHCVIIGFSLNNPIPKSKIYDGPSVVSASNINGYLLDFDDIFIENRSKPLCDVPLLLTGSQRIDKDNYIFTDEEKNEFVRKEPKSASYFKRWYGSDEFINNHIRWCLFLANCSPAELKQMPLCLDRVKRVRDYRLSSVRIQTKKAADYPNRFGLEIIPDSFFMIVPVVSSIRREYIPMGFMSPENLCSNQVSLIPNAMLYHFGVLESVVHMSWVRAIAGRLKSDYRYSKDIVYNNFPWPTLSGAQISKIEQTAQGILDARTLNSDSSLADLYDEVTMPPELRKAHRANDAAVMEAYGFRKDMTESEIVAELFKMYQKLVGDK